MKHQTHSQTMKQCVVCGDFHECNITGFMCDAHMCTMPNSNDYVCEWCFCYFCLKCGQPFRDDPTRAVPGKWLQRLKCFRCSQQQRLGDMHARIVKEYQKLLRTAAVTRDCKTCQTKLINGMLFWHANGNRMAIADTQHTTQLPERQDWAPPRPGPPLQPYSPLNMVTKILTNIVTNVASNVLVDAAIGMTTATDNLPVADMMTAAMGGAGFEG